jgi:hypothetical protein
MLRFGILRILAVLVFCLAVPFALYRLNRLIGLRLLFALAVAVGLGYGAIKADNSWSGQGLVDNALLMATSVLVVVCYVALSLGAAKAIASLRL